MDAGASAGPIDSFGSSISSSARMDKLATSPQAWNGIFSFFLLVCLARLSNSHRNRRRLVTDVKLLAYFFSNAVAVFYYRRQFDFRHFHL